ncbi:BTAD domain-containing putative transcriptional regulator [Candidatus Leptofilum sp.]|uniref:BTAD domain-containing putative transcriptional regulator n=1 Tax=Candidatus Leptofilum sp. TaxID=3241576 RepID=UPI003B5C93A1
MYQQSIIVRTKLVPPRPAQHTLPRQRIMQRLLAAQNHRLTIVQAGTGYGKSTALAALASNQQATFRFVWYRVEAEDSDAQPFLLHLLHGFGIALPNLSNAPLAFLEAWAQQRQAPSWTAVIDSLINELAQKLDQPTFLVLDDVHLINDSSEPIRILDRLIGLAPNNLHIILATRYPLSLPSLIPWRVKGQVLEIGQEELAFTPAEIDALFRETYGHALSLEQATMVISRIEGWPIALHLIWQQLQRDGGASLAQALTQLSGSASDLFQFLAHEVLNQQPDDVQAFLRETAVLREMTTPLCNQLRRRQDSQQLLRYLLEKGLFVVNLGNGYVRYHHLFRELLLSQLTGDEADMLHQQAATIYQQQGDDEEAIFHLLAAEAFEKTAVLLTILGRRFVRLGRLDTLAGWIGRLPPDILAHYPALLTYLGDIARLGSRFEEALGWYQQAEQRSRLQGDRRGIGQALRGQARVYLDTVNATKGEELLQEALRLSDGQEDRESQARLLELLAENLLNQGRMREAEDYQAKAQTLREQGPGTAELPVRMLLRTGRLAEARDMLEIQAEKEEQAPVLRPRAHRETLLLLSLILAYQGEAEMALATAVSGTNRGRLLNSEFITAVGHCRQGHAWLLHKNEHGYEQARQSFQQGIGMGDQMDVPRLKIEAFWGLCQAHGFPGDHEAALAYAKEGIALARLHGDEWVEMSIRLTMGATYTLLGMVHEANEWLAQAGNGFHDCSDIFGETAVRLWRCLLWHQTGDETRLKRDLDHLLPQISRHQFEFLFTRRTLLGPPDPRALVPLLLFAREQEQHAAIAEAILAQLELAHLSRHPGFQLRIQTLGPFRIWQGDEELPSKAWRRKKSRQLLQLLLTHRGTLLHRDQIAEMLWPDLNPEGAVRDFKIAFSAMCSVLEPSRKRNAPSAFVMRDGSRYGLRAEADIWLDTAVFEQNIDEGDQLYQQNVAEAVVRYETAVALYEGDYLQAYPYETWTHEERERLRARYLHGANRLAQWQAKQQNWERVINLCQAILQNDDCWENAYRLLIQAHIATGNRVQALRTFQRCESALQAGLGVQPAPATTQLYETIR